MKLNNGQVNILFEASILANGIYNDASRSGIYVVAYNIFKRILKYDNIKLTLFCKYEKIEDLKNYLREYFPNEKFKIIIDKPDNFVCNSYIKLKEFRDKLKNKKSKWKGLLQLCLLPLSLISNLFETLYLKTLNVSGYDAFLSLFDTIPTLISSKKIKKFTFLHDTIPLLFPDITQNANGTRGWFKILTDSLCKENYYFANSENTKNDFIKHYKNLDASKIKTILLACDEKFKPINNDEISKTKAKYNIPSDKRYVFSLCTLEPRKNLTRAVKTFIQFIKKNNIDDLVFVLGGGQWDKFVSIIEQEIENQGDYKNKIIKAGYVDDEDLPALYSGAEWFIYTSQYEGFGLPPLEAMSCGCPVITSNNSSLPEVVGTAGIMIDFDSDEQHINAYEKYYYSEDLRKENALKGIKQAKIFSWDKCTNEIVEELVANNV